ncbi:outer membrane protein assembly factor BamB family protein [Actinoplanes flavus]|uniref:PQQ-binding-like beta-propeller repeat protein n=1 Tax=Actinoplanes flavus TaxID=2820290 RepID=A0ABS3UP93_9ACTN|nr:PQQ-binding-like beta-propeller repeat protein [Actinoplanes flavus]MBO3739563.1 PQQ-binding-like beta-propeller repeat protein [Actinoplanes flavus]
MLAWFLSVTLAAGAAASPAAAAAAPVWDHPGYDAENSHYNPAEDVINAGSIRRAGKKWQVKLRSSDTSCSGYSAPLLSGGRVVTTDQLGVSAYTADTGRLLWRYDWDDPGDNGTPRLGIVDGLVILTNNGCNSQSDPDGQIVALDLRSGLPRWRQGTDIPVVDSSVDKGVIVVSGGSPSDEDKVVAFSARDGRTLWTRAKHLSSGVSANGTILLRRTDGSEAAQNESTGVDIVTGRVRWTRKADWTAEAADPDGTRFYVRDEKTQLLSAVRVADGQPAWTAPLFPSMIAVDGNRLYRVFDKGIEAFRVTDGKRLWTVRSTTETAQPVRAGGLLYSGGQVRKAADGTVAGPTYAGEVIVAGGRIHQVLDGTLSSYAP